MVVGAFPAAKLGVLAFKQLSKPVANLIKERAKTNPFFRRYVCMPPAQFYNWVEVKTKMWALNLGKPVNVPQLNEAMAIELGANLLGEVIIFTIGAGLLIFEYVRSVNKETKKEELLKQEKAELMQTLCDLQLHVERQDAQMREMNRVLADLDSRSWLSRKLNFLQAETPSEGCDPPRPPPPNAADPVAVPLTTAAQIVGATTNTASSRPSPTIAGNYDPSRGLLHKALHLIETEVFYSELAYSQFEQYGRVQSALAYLGYAPPSRVVECS